MYKTIKNIDFPMVQTIKNTLLIFFKKVVDKFIFIWYHIIKLRNKQLNHYYKNILEKWGNHYETTNKLSKSK